MSAIRIARPGCPAVLVLDEDPYAGLTQRQRHIVDVVRAHNGNRSRAARQLGVTVPTVQSSLRMAERIGLTLPPIARRGPDLRQRIRS